MKKVGLVFGVLLLLGIWVSASLAAEGKYSTIILKEFSLEGAAIQENPDTEAFAKGLPSEFSQMVEEFLQAYKVSQNVVRGEGPSTNAVIVEGRFTKITAGSTAARIVVGWGAGSSTVGAEWTVKDATTGKVLGKYNKNQHSSSSVRGIHALESDSRYLAKYVASTISKLMK
ncbi:MAG: DUF4410 domain-containing protein [candidate division NC10 bacterium]|nr:DUF4410 domain-containing protein [candidate division NC10 bacterium]